MSACRCFFFFCTDKDLRIEDAVSATGRERELPGRIEEGAGPADELEEVAAELWRDERLRSLPPDAAAVVWLGPGPADALLSRYIPAMCNRYESPEIKEIERFWHIGARQTPPWARDMFPRAPGPFIRRRRDATGYERELVVGQWGLIPWFAKEPKLTYPTNNARSEELAEKASYKDPLHAGLARRHPARRRRAGHRGAHLRDRTTLTMNRVPSVSL